MLRGVLTDGVDVDVVDVVEDVVVEVDVGATVVVVVVVVVDVVVVVAPTPLVSPLTCTGVLLSVRAALPSCPSLLNPQHLAAPVTRRAQACEPLPVLMATTPLVSPLTCVGVDFPTMVPSPTCPLSLKPQQFAAPVLRTAHVKSPPDEIAVTPPVSPVTCVGVQRSVTVVPSPS